VFLTASFLYRSGRFGHEYLAFIATWFVIDAAV
jgi:hypothetical protein